LAGVAVPRRRGAIRSAVAVTLMRAVEVERREQVPDRRHVARHIAVVVVDLRIGEIVA
jgi:hypothetical protein